jgi:hypothetical protein
MEKERGFLLHMDLITTGGIYVDNLPGMRIHQKAYRYSTNIRMP